MNTDRFDGFSNSKPAARRPVRRGLLALLFSALAALAPLAHGQRQQPAPPRPAGESTADAALYQALLDLNNPWTVMCVAAHPDDEDGSTLTLLRRKYGVHTVTLFSTYGEGGQNAVGPELYEELGAIRARETEEAAAIQGSEPWFLGLRDFGFSKSAEEAFRVWGHEEALRRMVLKIRQLHPDVIITNHDTTSGHGHHQATGRLVLEAFDAAADPARFPEQLRDGISTWQPQRLFVRIFSERGAAGPSSSNEPESDGATISLDTSERDPVRGTTYAEQALRALQRHASQGPWPQTLPPGWMRVIRYRLVRSAKQSAALPAGARTLLDGLQLPEQVATALAAPKIQNRPLTDFISDRTRLFHALAGARIGGFGRATPGDAPRFRLMTERLNLALAAFGGITLTVTPRDAVVVPNSSTTLSINISNSGEQSAQVEVTGVAASGSGRGWPNRPLNVEPHGVITLTKALNIPGNESLTLPHSAHLYDAQTFGKRLEVTARVELNGISFPLVAATRVDVAPAVEITGASPPLLVLTPGNIARPQPLFLRLVNHQRTRFEGYLGSANRAERAQPAASFALRPGETREVTVRFPAHLLASLQAGGVAPGKEMPLAVWSDRLAAPVTRINIPAIYSDARVAPGLRVGYVRSFDDTLRDALSALGVQSRELTIEEVRAGKLDGYGAIVIDNRGYQAHPELIAANAQLLDYARAGGTLIVFYHKTNEWNPDAQKGRPQLAPYPITLGNSRITDETAPVTFIEPRHPLLNFPNRITEDDFKGWIQERGLYYPEQWDERYSAPLAASDAGEAPLRGGLLAARYGRGRYIYTSMVWYRQLRAGVPGAYRVFANLISYGRADDATAK
ncbi:MAG TPA: PIG-L family deacetylase [Pyrinomonadaceae bacterium]